MKRLSPTGANVSHARFTLTTYYTCVLNVLYRIEKGQTQRIVQLCRTSRSKQRCRKDSTNCQLTRRQHGTRAAHGTLARSCAMSTREGSRNYYRLLLLLQQQRLRLPCHKYSTCCVAVCKHTAASSAVQCFTKEPDTGTAQAMQAHRLLHRQRQISTGCPVQARKNLTGTPKQSQNTHTHI